MIRFVHTADWQLGMTRHFLSEDAQSRYTAARIAAIGSIGALAAREKCEFVLVCGDVFESNEVSPDLVGRALEAMRQAEVPFYLLPGNHDPLNAASVWDRPQFRDECPPNVTVLRDPGPYDVPGGYLIAAPWTGKRPEPGATVRQFREAEAREDGISGSMVVFAAHGGVDLLSPDAGAVGVLRREDLRVELGVASVGYLALGDRHSVTCVDEGIGNGSHSIWYPGSPEATNFDDVETGSGQALVVELSPTDGVTVQSHRVGTWQMRTIAAELNGKADVGRLGEQLSAIPDKENIIVRLALKGALSVAERAELDELLQRHGRLFASLRLWQRHTDLVTVPAAGEFDGFSGFVGEAAQELAEQAKTGSEDAQRALGLLLRLGQGAGA
jgi:DNA repair exonuclease SbcCD nuclease subunit